MQCFSGCHRVCEEVAPSGIGDLGMSLVPSRRAGSLLTVCGVQPEALQGLDKDVRVCHKYPDLLIKLL